MTYRSHHIDIPAANQTRVKLNPELPLGQRSYRIMVANTGTNDIRIGGPDLTPTNGFTIAAGTTWTDTPDTADHLYGISADNTAGQCEVLEGGMQ